MSPVNFHDYRELVYRHESGELIINYWGRPPLSAVSRDPWADSGSDHLQSQSEMIRFADLGLLESAAVFLGYTVIMSEFRGRDDSGRCSPLYSVSPDRFALSPWGSVSGRPPGAQVIDPDQISESWSSWDQPGLDHTPEYLGVHQAFSRFAARSSLRSLIARGRV